jgi:colanic acid biosynthesis glycosyl transferase WcaI
MRREKIDRPLPTFNSPLMRILYLSQYFPPESGATQSRAHDMAKHFVRRGHTVTVLTEIPNHPSGVIHPDYQGRLYTRSDLDGIDVIRVWVKASQKKDFKSRMIFYLSFMINATLAGLFISRRHYDLIYASSPPLFVGAAALVLSIFKRTRLVFEVRDLWPESAVALGEISNPRYIEWATRLEESCYRHASHIIVVTQGVFNRLETRGLSKSKLKVIPNGADTDEFNYRDYGGNQVRTRLGLDNKFISVYAGIFGLAQGLETIIECAKLLQEDHRFHFLLVGEGPKKSEITTLATRYQLSNLTILPEQPRAAIPDLLSAADVALVPLRKVDLFTITIPSKLFDAWACERPVVMSIDGEARLLLERAHGGMYVTPESPEEMAQALIQLFVSPEERIRMGKNGRDFTQHNYSRQALADQLLHILDEGIRS